MPGKTRVPNGVAGALQQRIGVEAVHWITAFDPHTGGHSHFAATHAKWACKQGQQSLRAPRGAVRAIRPAHNQGKSVAANPARKVLFFDTPAQPLRYLLQQFIARRVAQGVVDQPEFVKVQTEHRHLGTIQLDPQNGALQVFLNPRPIG